MSDRIVTTETCAKALDWLRDSAMALGQAKARAIKADHMATLRRWKFKGSDASSNDARRADARNSEQIQTRSTRMSVQAASWRRCRRCGRRRRWKIESHGAFREANFRSMKI